MVDGVLLLLKYFGIEIKRNIIYKENMRIIGNLQLQML
jgi:hypothetical protein